MLFTEEAGNICWERCGSYTWTTDGTDELWVFIFQKWVQLGGVYIRSQHKTVMNIQHLVPVTPDIVIPTTSIPRIDVFHLEPQP